MLWKVNDRFKKKNAFWYTYVSYEFTCLRWDERAITNILTITASWDIQVFSSMDLAYVQAWARLLDLSKPGNVSSFRQMINKELVNPTLF